jgi:hypothetical protein
MPKNTVSDPITDQEMAFALLIMSGTMTDRQAAEAVGLNPDTAAYIKSKPRVRAYMNEHRAAVRERLVDQEADLSRPAVEGLRKLNLGRDQILARLWELATLSHEVTRGTIAGQIKALSMIVAIEGLIPSGMNARRLSPSATQPAAPPVEPDIYTPEWLRKQEHQSGGEDPGDPVAATKTQPAAPHVPEPEPTPEQPPNLLTTRRRPTLTATNPPLPIPSSTPEARTGFPPQPAASSTPLWTEGTTSGCPFPWINASLGGVAEVDKRPNFIEFYKISRSRDSSGATSAGRSDLQYIALAGHHLIQHRVHEEPKEQP